MRKYSDYEKNLLATIKDHGWQFSYVFDPEGEKPNFGYSTGFSQSLNAPEFIVFGLPQRLSHNMLWEIFRQIEQGASVADGQRWQGLLEGHDCISRKAINDDTHEEYTLSADWFWQETGNAGLPEVYQLVWPGAAQGLFPWEEGCSQVVIDDQPHLWLPYIINQLKISGFIGGDCFEGLNIYQVPSRVASDIGAQNGSTPYNRRPPIGSTQA